MKKICVFALFFLLSVENLAFSTQNVETKKNNTKKVSAVVSNKKSTGSTKKNITKNTTKKDVVKNDTVKNSTVKKDVVKKEVKVEERPLTPEEIESELNEQRELSNAPTTLTSLDISNIGLDDTRISLSIFEACNLNKAVIQENMISNNGQKIRTFIDTSIKNYNSDEGRIIDEYTALTKQQSQFINGIFSKVISNLERIEAFNIKERTNICSSITDYIYDSNKNMNDYMFKNYSGNGEFLVTSNLTITDDSKLKLDVSIWDTLDNKVIGKQDYILNNNNAEKVATLLSDFIYTTTTGEKIGLFTNKVIYVAETGDIFNRQKFIRMMDINGDNNVVLSDGKNLVINPTFNASNREEVFYLEYSGKKANFFKENIKTKERTLIRIGNGIVYAPVFNPADSNQVAISIAEESGTNIFLLDMSSNRYTRLTRDQFINTSPSFSPKDNKLVYVSDKSGIKKLYVADLNTGKSEKITKSRGNYDKPVWSYDNKLIAFIKIENGLFKLGLITPDGENERYLTEAYLIDGLKWTQNSRYLIYSKQKGAFGGDSIPQLYMIDILTGTESRLNTPLSEGASDLDISNLEVVEDIAPDTISESATGLVDVSTL